MYYLLEVEDHIRVPPHLFGLSQPDSIIQGIKEKYDGMISKELGIVIDVTAVSSIGEGIIIPGDGASYYKTGFELLVFKPEMQEIVEGRIKDIADFGAFLNLGPIEAMVHVSQAMDDFVSFSKDKVLAGKDTKRTLKVGDSCRGRIIAVSFKDLTNPKINVTMRQPLLGKLEWIEEEKNKKEKK